LSSLLNDKAKKLAAIISVNGCNVFIVFKFLRLLLV